MIINQFGNYLCQKIIEGADPIILSAIINQINEQLVFISLNVHGTRSIQTLIEKLACNINHDLKSEEVSDDVKFINHCNLTKVINALNSQIVDLTMNMHGNHVLQQFLMVFQYTNSDLTTKEYANSEMYTQFIFDACMTNIISIGKHKHGCCVMQRCLEKGTWI